MNPYPLLWDTGGDWHYNVSQARQIPPLCGGKFYEEKLKMPHPVGKF